MAPALAHPTGVNFIDDQQRPVHSDASTYYGGEERFSRGRTYSASFAHGYNPKRPPVFGDEWHQCSRRMSHDEKNSAPRRFLIDVDETIRVVPEQEDTDGDFQISVTDAGPKLMALGTATSNGFKSFDVRVSAPHAAISRSFFGVSLAR